MATSDRDEWRRKLGDARLGAWSKYISDPLRPLVALTIPHHIEPWHLEELVDNEQKTVFDRLRLVAAPVKATIEEKNAARCVLKDGADTIAGTAIAARAREAGLENVCTVLVTYAKPGAAIELRDVQLHCPEVTSSRRLDAELLVDDDATFAEAELSWEREFLRSRLDRHDGNQTKAAKSLDLHYSTLIRKMERCGLPGAMSRNE